jgi:hypothetical protein
MAKEMSIEDLRVSAKQSDLDLSDEELQRLLPGVNRAKSQAAELRQWIGPNDEPAEKFRVPGRPGK